jgi:hypothetical protein
MVVALLLVVSRAGASTEGDDPAARAARAEHLFQQGTEAFEAGRFEEAYRLHADAWQAHASFKTAVGLGQVELHLGRHRDAAEHLAYAIRRFPPGMDPEIRGNIEAGFAAAREHVATLRVRSNVEGARILLDGKDVGTAPLEGPMFVEPGRHVLEAVQAGYSSASMEVDAIIRATREVALTLSPDEKPSAAPVDATTADVAPATLVLIGGGALTAAAIATALIFEIRGASLEDEIDGLRTDLGGDEASTRCASPSTDDAILCRKLGDKVDDRDSASHLAVASWIGAGVFAAGTSVATYLLWDSDSRGPSADARTGPTVRAGFGPAGGSVFVRGRF